MADNVGSKVTYFIVGLGVGALMGVLFAPKSGDETRDFLTKKADEGKEYAQRKARELRERADELIERGKEVAVRKKDSISAAVEAGREAYLRESKQSSQ
ncbi:MAG: YtxH domain-containing protein [Acidobacteria bacterium]|nr:MAG: YtxH domain-containing protein [Acidobacteriota bacterium]